MAAPALRAVDWGTSSFRAWLVDTNGNILRETQSTQGILSLVSADFDAALEAEVGAWLDEAPAIPVIASGMITSRNGWVETPYATLPLDAARLAGKLTRHVTHRNRTVYIVTGASSSARDGQPDVMRGEETEMVGYLATSNIADGVIVLPGTHSKWASVSNGRISDFATFMTGELYAVLLGHSIIGRLAASGSESVPAFRRGVQAAIGSGSLASKLFSARSLQLFNEIEAGEVRDYLSGLLIGDEIRSGLELMRVKPDTIIARGDLASRYARAFSEFGYSPSIATPGMACRGLVEIATLAGLTDHALAAAE